MNRFLIFAKRVILFPKKRFTLFFTKVILPWLMCFPSYHLRLFIVKRRFKYIGKNVSFLRGVTFVEECNISIGDNTVINTRCHLDGRGGELIIGKNVDIAQETNIWTAEHDVNDDYHVGIGASVVIDDYVWLASRVTVLPGVHIGRGAVVACGAIVTKDVPSMNIVAGVPAKPIGMRKSELKYEFNYHPLFE